MINFMVNDDGYMTMVAEEVARDPENAWIKELSPEAQQEYSRITLNVMADDPNYDLLESDSYDPSPDVLNKMMRKYFENDEIAEGLLENGEFDKHNTPENAAALKKLNSSWSDWDFTNLNNEQKGEIFVYVMNNPHSIE